MPNIRLISLDHITYVHRKLAAKLCICCFCFQSNSWWCLGEDWLFTVIEAIHWSNIISKFGMFSFTEFYLVMFSNVISFCFWLSVYYQQLVRHCWTTCLQQLIGYWWTSLHTYQKNIRPLMKHLLSAVDRTLLNCLLSAVDRALLNCLLSAVDRGIDKLPVISSIYRGYYRHW